MARRSRSADSGATLFAGATLGAGAREPSEDFAPRVIVGVDEAGFGPMLGPLTIGCVALRTRGNGGDPWTSLASAVARPGERTRPRRSEDTQVETAPRVLVGDSKAVFERNARGRERLEHTVLAFHAALHGLPGDGRAFLSATPPPLGCGEIAAEFWLPSVPRRLSDCADASLASACTSVGDAVRRAELQVATCAVRAVPPQALNASFARTGSKGATHWEQCAPFFVHAFDAYGLEGVELVVDRHGGRMRYAGLLAATFPGATVTTESEVAARSVYRVRGPDARCMRVTFAEKADALSFAVALASCCAKYARELCMDGFNAHFARLQPDLEPTAGYVTDARRWLVDAAPALGRAGLSAAALVRTR